MSPLPQLPYSGHLTTALPNQTLHAQPVKDCVASPGIEPGTGRFTASLVHPVPLPAVGRLQTRKGVEPHVLPEHQALGAL